MAFMAKLVGVTILAAGALSAGSVLAGTLDEVRANGVLRIAYRQDAPPFSHSAADTAEPAGFMVELCRAVVAGIGLHLRLAELRIAFVPVTSSDRFEAITGGRADLLCEATTHSLKRRETLAFSIPTFADGASFMTLPDGPDDLGKLDGRKIGVLVATTTEADLRRALAEAKSTAEVVAARTHQEGLDAVERGAISAYFADRAILTYLSRQGRAPASLLIADIYLSIEPYALAMRRGDEDFQLAVDRELSRIYRSGEINRIFTAVFGASVQPSPMLEALYATAALPE